MVESYLSSPAYIAGIRTVLSAQLKKHMACYWQDKDPVALREAINSHYSSFKQEIERQRVIPTGYKMEMSYTWNSVIKVIEVELDIVPIQGNCTECNGTGGLTFGHHDQGYADCKYCEGTGIRKWLKCKNCGKFGTVDAPEKGFLCHKECPVCDGKKTLPLNYYDSHSPFDID